MQISPTSCHISGIGAYIPKPTYTSEELMNEANTEAFGIPNSYLARVTGIKERRFSSKDDLPSDMAAVSSMIALRDSGISPNDLDIILFCGIDKDFVEPATAHAVQEKVGAYNATCFDLGDACHGVITGIDVASAYIASGRAEHVLVCTGEKPSRVTQKALEIIRKNSDRFTFEKYMGALTVGDAGGAIIVSRSYGESGFKSMNFSSHGEYHKYCYYKFDNEELEFQMLMQKISTQGLRLHEEMINNTYEKLGWTPESVGKIYCHQVGAKPHKEFAKLARQPLNRTPKTFDLYGNLTSAAIIVTMFLYRPSPGERVIILGAGSGLKIGQLGMVA